MTDDREQLEGLLARAKRGEQEAGAELLDRYRNYLRLIARIHIDTTLQAKADPSDLVQETMMRAYPQFTTFQGTGEQELVAWLRRILVTTAVDMVRRYRGTKRRDVTLERQLADDLDRSAEAIDRLAAPASVDCCTATLAE